MRRILAVLLLCLSTAFAAEPGTDILKIKVVDPNNAAVAGARVAIYYADTRTAKSIQNTSAEGQTSFHGLGGGKYRVQVLAPGFAAQTVTLAFPEQNEVRVELRLAVASETVEVTATRTPLPADESGSAISSLNGQQLTAMQPVATAEALRFLPGAVVNNPGQMGGQASLFVRGGESRDNKVIIDDVPVNDPGGVFDFGVVPMEQIDRLEFLRGSQSTLYGSDAMTSVVQMWSRSGSSRVPVLMLGADGGNLGTAHGYTSFSGASGKIDYNLFGGQFNTLGEGINDAYSNSSEGANIGVMISSRSSFRFRTRYSNSRTGLPGEWNYNGQALLTPDSDQYARQSNFLSSAEFILAAPDRWQHRFVGFEYNHRYSSVDTFMDPGRAAAYDFPYSYAAHYNRAGLDYQGDYSARSWAHTTLGYHFEDENGFLGDPTAPPMTHGVRLNQAVFGQQALTWRRVTLIAGLRLEHNESFGNKVVPRFASSYVLRRGSDTFGATRLRFAYAQGIVAPRFDESLAGPPFYVPNPNLKAEQNRSLEAGIQQNFANGKYSVSATYYNNHFDNLIDYKPVSAFAGQYVNVDEALAHGAELVLHARPIARLDLQGAYTYTSTQVLKAPYAYDVEFAPGAPLQRRPRHSGSLLAGWTTPKWGASLGGSFVGRRPNYDFIFPNLNTVPGYALLNVSCWRAIQPRVTAYLNVDNVLDQHYQEVLGYPALGTNFRAGMRFRIGGE